MDFDKELFKHMLVIIENLNENITNLNEGIINLQKDVDDIRKVIVRQCVCEEKVK